MNNPFEIAYIKRVLTASGKPANRSLGQNFLVNADAAARILALGGAARALEVGPGLGALTHGLARARERITAIELDARLARELTAGLAGFAGVRVVSGDALGADYAALLDELGGPFDVYSSLPYYITTELILTLLGACRAADSMVFIMQSEAADRLLAQPGGKEYGLLALTAEYFSVPERCFDLPPHCFYPQPGVNSCVVRLCMRRALPPPEHERALFALMRAGFAARRKTLCNNLAGAYGGKAAVSEALAFCGLPGDIRAERLALADFERLKGALDSQKER